MRPESTDVTDARALQAPVDTALVGQLMVRVVAGDRASFMALYDILAPYLYRLAASLTIQDQQAEQVTSEVFAASWRTARSCPAGGSAALRWAVRITYQRAATGGHRTSGRPARVGPDDVCVGSGTSTRERLRALTAAQRASIVLASSGAFTYRQIGDLMDKPAHTVAVLHRDALIRMRDTVATVDQRHA